MSNKLIHLTVLIAAIAAGLLLEKLGIPLPWVLGPMLSTTILKLRYPAVVSCPRRLRNVFMIPLGYNIGIYINSEACQSIAGHFTGIILVTVATIGFCVLLALLTTRISGVSHSSSVIGNMPGGLTPMILICDKIPSADLGVVVILQSVRLMLTISLIPFILVYGGLGSAEALSQRSLLVDAAALSPLPLWQLMIASVAGALFFDKLNVPAAFFIGPIIPIGLISLYTGAHLPEIPTLLLNSAQLVTGLYLGTHIDPFQLSRNHRLLPVCFLGGMLIVLASLVIGYATSNILGISLATAFLACSPGGVTEMCIVGMALGEDVPMILAYQLFRLLFLNFIMPPSIKWFFTRGEKQA